MKHYSDIIEAPVITEKSMEARGENVYIFKANKKATKYQIKKAIEEAFNVKVKKINTLVTKPKKKRVGRHSGLSKTFKKAIVTLEDGQSIDI